MIISFFAEITLDKVCIFRKFCKLHYLPALTENFTTKRLIERLQNELRSNCRQKNVDGVLAVIELQIFTVANGDLRFTVVLFFLLSSHFVHYSTTLLMLHDKTVCSNDRCADIDDKFSWVFCESMPATFCHHLLFVLRYGIERTAIFLL